MDKEVEVKKEKSPYGKYDKWEVESWARTLEDAEMIKQDATKMKYVKQCMQEKLKGMKNAIKSIDDIRQARQDLPDEDSEYES